ncbi:hypothetical protein BJF84_00120 [Rhodococcus sp. CUA-806]|jgi:hypothetical protein|nr:hypothetical protein BJF84_00120 [Rhodococcus sp. CUA-806]
MPKKEVNEDRINKLKEFSLVAHVDEFLKENSEFIDVQVGPLVASLVHLAASAQQRAEDNQISSAQAAGEFRQTYVALRKYVDEARDRKEAEALAKELEAQIDTDEALLGAYK